MFKLNVLTPEKKLVVDLEAQSVTVPLASGEVQILPGHVPMIATLGTGVLKYKALGSDSEQKIVISWGYCEVSAEGVNVLAEFVKTKNEINAEKERINVEQNEAKLLTEVLDDAAYEATLAEIQKSQSSIQVLH